MPWSKAQIRAAATAWRNTGLPDAQRKLVLRQFPRALFDAQGQPADEPSSRSAKLTNTDFDEFMVLAERLGNSHNGTFDTSWSDRVGDGLNRLRDKAQRIANTLELTTGPGGKPMLDPSGGLAGWIRTQVTHDAARVRLDDLNGDELRRLIEGLKDYGRRNGVRWQDERHGCSRSA